MRVIAGKAGSLKLKTPKGMETRPTTDRIKETLFNMLAPALPDSIFIDLFSGSGAIGIEALSRGAAHAYFVEHHKNALACIQDNLRFTGLIQDATILRQDVFAAIPCIPEKEADVIFMDPPYGQELERRVLEVLSTISYVTSNTLIVTEAALATDFSYAEALGFDMIREKCYKTNKHVFLRKSI